MKSFPPYLFLILTIVFNALTSITFKFASLKEFSKQKVIMCFVLGLLFGLGNIFFYFRSLKTFNLNFVYPVGVAANTIILTVVAYWLFKENITAVKSIGMSLIIGGIFLISRY